MPLGSVRALAPSVMVNLLGDCWFAQDGDAGGADVAREPDWAAVLAHPGVKLHLYGKSQARPGRKMGHATVLGDSADECLQTALLIEQQLGIRP
jgi:5-(carboxyamino)imidazole ribonucleotide synthase